MNALIDYLAEARSAHLRGDWSASYAAFVRADGLGPMSTDDLDAYSLAAWRLGYLAYLEAATALDAGDVARAAPAAAVLREAASGTGDTTLAVLARVVDGMTALMESRVSQGYRLLDDALVPVLDDRIPLEWAGDLYRLVLRSGDRVDAYHRQVWTVSMQRWVVTTGVVIDSGAAT